MRRLFATVGTLALAGVVFAGPAPEAPPAPSIPQLVARLGSEDFREREAAAGALEKAGAAAMPALREAAGASDPEVRQRAAAILHKLQRAADSTSKLAPKKVSLDYKDVPIGTAANDLKRRTGLNIVFDHTRVADPLRKVTCSTGEVSPWEALDAFCAAAGLREEFRLDLDVPKVQPNGRRTYNAPQIPGPEAVPIVLVDGKGPRPPGDRRTAVRVLALPASFPGHRVTLGTGEVTLCFDVAPAPGLNWQDVTAVKITKLTDDAGRAGGAGSPRPADSPFDAFDGGVVVFAAPGGGFAMGGPGFGGRFDPRTGAPIYPDTAPNPRVIAVPLKLGTPAARSIKRLEGAVLGEITLTNQTLVTVPDPVKNVGAAFDGGGGRLRLTVVSATEAKGGGAVLQLLLQHPSPWSVGARRGWNPGGIWPEAPRSANAMPVVQAFDAAGKLMPATTAGSHTDSSDDGLTMLQHVTMTFRKDAGTPAKLVVTGPRPLIVEVPFVMENVPLP